MRVEDDEPKAQRKHVIAGADLEEVPYGLLLMTRRSSVSSCGATDVDGWTICVCEEAYRVADVLRCGDTAKEKESLAYQALSLVPVDRCLWRGWRHWARMPSWSKVG